MEELNEQTVSSVAYTEENIRHLSDMEHVRTRPGMYIGRLGDGSQVEDGIYVLLKEVVDNSIDEFKMGAGKRIEIQMEDNLRVSVRDYGRGIPLGSLVDAVSMLNTGGKYDTKGLKKKCRSERSGSQGGQCIEQPFRGLECPRRTDAQGRVRTWRTGQRRDLRHGRRKRNLHLL